MTSNGLGPGTGGQQGGAGAEYPAPGPGSFPPPGAPQGDPAPAPGYGTPPTPGTPPGYVGYGTPPAPGPPPGYGPPAGPAYGAGGTWRAVHKPGVLPLRPLKLGDLFDASFKTIRQNPQATVGVALLVGVLSMALPVLVATALSLGAGVSTDSPTMEEDLVYVLGPMGSLLIGYLLLSVGTYLITAVVSHVAMVAALGGRVSLAEAWAMTRGHRWRTLGLVGLLTLVTVVAIAVYVATWFPVVAAGSVEVAVVWGVVTIPALLALLLWFSARIWFLSVPALVLEDLTVIGAIRRAWQLSRRQTWRLLGIMIVTSLLTQVAASLVSTPITVLGVILSLAVPEYALTAQILSQALATVIGVAFTAPFLALVGAFLYVDQRIRKEAYDVELLARTGQMPR